LARSRGRNRSATLPSPPLLPGIYASANSPPESAALRWITIRVIMSSRWWYIYLVDIGFDEPLATGIANYIIFLYGAREVAWLGGKRRRMFQGVVGSSTGELFPSPGVNWFTLPGW